MLDLPADQLALVQDVLRQHLPGRHVIAFGSRATGKARKFSDLDLCIMGEECVEWQLMGEISYALEESPLPIRVDLLDWASTSPEFRNIIINQPNIVIQEAS